MSVQLQLFNGPKASKKSFVMDIFMSFPTTAFSPSEIEKIIFPKSINLRLETIRTYTTKERKKGVLMVTGKKVTGKYGNPENKYKLTVEARKELEESNKKSIK